MPPANEKPLLSRNQTITYKRLLNVALQLFEQGYLPSVTEVAKAADISRATAYRYFSTQNALISAVVDSCLKPMQLWQPTDNDMKKRINALLQFAYPQLEQHEGALRAALLISLQQWADIKTGNKVENPFIRGKKKKMMEMLAAPFENSIASKDLKRLKQALSLLYGAEIFLVFKDIWAMESTQIHETIMWMAKALVRQTEEDSGVSLNFSKEQE